MDVGVFVNCPFDARYAKKFRSIVFTTVYCGFDPRCALEVADGGQNRLEKILQIIEECPYAIHDISRVQLSAERLPRFNMPFELGLFLGAKAFGNKGHRNKKCLVLDSIPYRYQKFLSDISGQDIAAHNENFREVITQVRNWLAQFKADLLPGEQPITKDFEKIRPGISGYLQAGRDHIQASNLQ